MDEFSGNGRAMHLRAQAGAMLHEHGASFARAIVKMFDEPYTLLRRTVKVQFSGINAEFVPVGRLAKRGAVAGTTYLFMRKLGEPETLFVFDWSQHGGALPVAMLATNADERANSKLLGEIEYPRDWYDAAGFKAPPLRADERDESGKPLDEKRLNKLRAERMSERLQSLLAIAVPIHTLRTTEG